MIDVLAVLGASGRVDDIVWFAERGGGGVGDMHRHNEACPVIHKTRYATITWRAKNAHQSVQRESGSIQAFFKLQSKIEYSIFIFVCSFPLFSPSASSSKLTSRLIIAARCSPSHSPPKVLLPWPPFSV